MSRVFFGSLAFIILSATTYCASAAQLTSLRIVATLTGNTNPVCVRAIIKKSDGTYVTGEWGNSSWPAVTLRGKAVGPDTIITIPTGTTQITVGKGPDYLPQTLTTNLPNSIQTNVITFALQPQMYLYNKGWRAGDAHTHYFHGEGEILRSPQDCFVMAAAGGNNFLSMGEEHYGATTLTRQQMLDVWKPFEASECKMWLSVEEPKNQWGHHASILYEPWSVRSAIPYSWGVRDVHAQGGVSYPVHPERFYPLRSYNGTYFHYPLNNNFKNFPLEALTGHMLDAWSGVSDEAYNNTTLSAYRKLLSLGYKIPLLADSDFCFDRINNGPHALGFWMNYFLLEGNPLSRAAVCNAIRRGKAMCTTGPLVLFSIDNATSGDTLPADGTPHTVRIEASYRFNPWTLSGTNFAGTQPCRIAQIDLLRNGEVFTSWTPNTATALVQQVITETTNNSHYMVRVIGNEGVWMAGYASPIYFGNTVRPRQPPVFKSLVQGRLYDARTGNSLTGLVSCVRYGKSEWTIPTDAQGRFRATVPIDSDVVATDGNGRTFTQNVHKMESVYSFLSYLPDNFPDKAPSVDALSNLVSQVAWEFPMGHQLAASYIRTNLQSDGVMTNFSILTAPAPFPGKANTEIVMLLVDKTQVEPGDTINYAAIFRKSTGGTPSEELGITWAGWDATYPRMYTKYQTVFHQNKGTSGHVNLGNGFYLRGGSVIVPNWVTNYATTTAAIDMYVSVRSGAFLESAHMLIRRGPTQRQLTVSSTWDGFSATWGELGVGPCSFFRDGANFAVRYADYRSITVQFSLNGQLITVNPKGDTASVADADDAMFWENFYYDGQCEPQYRNVPFRDPIRTQPLQPDYSSVPIQNPSDTNAPTVALLEPLNGESVSNPVRFYYYVDDLAVSEADSATLLIDSTPLITQNAKGPIILNLNPGLHTWQVRATDKSGNISWSEIRTVNVSGSGATDIRPLLVSTLFTNPQQLQFSFASVSGKNYTMQFSTNLVDWSTLFATNAATNQVYYVDSSAKDSLRFYRVVLAP